MDSVGGKPPEEENRYTQINRFTFPVWAPLFGCWSPAVPLIDPKKDELGGWLTFANYNISHGFQRPTDGAESLYISIAVLFLISASSLQTIPLVRTYKTIAKKRKEETITFLPGCSTAYLLRVAKTKKGWTTAEAETEIKSELLYMPRWNSVWLARCFAFAFIHVRRNGKRTGGWVRGSLVLFAELILCSAMNKLACEIGASSFRFRYIE